MWVISDSAGRNGNTPGTSCLLEEVDYCVLLQCKSWIILTNVIDCVATGSSTQALFYISVWLFFFSFYVVVCILCSCFESLGAHFVVAVLI